MPAALISLTSTHGHHRRVLPSSGDGRGRRRRKGRRGRWIRSRCSPRPLARRLLVVGSTRRPTRRSGCAETFRLTHKPLSLSLHSLFVPSASPVRRYRSPLRRVVGFSLAPITRKFKERLNATSKVGPSFSVSSRCLRPRAFSLTVPAPDKAYLIQIAQIDTRGLPRTRVFPSKIQGYFQSSQPR